MLFKIKQLSGHVKESQLILDYLVSECQHTLYYKLYVERGCMNESYYINIAFLYQFNNTLTTSAQLLLVLTSFETHCHGKDY